MPKSLTGPAGDLPGNPPRGRTDGTGLCCACPAEGPVNSVGDTKYFSCTYNPGWNIRNRARLAISRTNTGGTVTVSKTFSLSYSNGATPEAHAATITTALSSAMASWTSAARSWRIQITQPGCEVQKLTMVFVSTIAASADVAVTVDNKTPAALPDGTTEELRSYVSQGTAMNFFVQGTGEINWTMIHEVGHTLGLPDEYTYNRPAAVPAPVCTYKGADNPDKAITLSPSTIPADAVGQHGFDNPSVMGQNGNTDYPDNLFFWVAIEVKNLMQDQGVTADVQVVPS